MRVHAAVLLALLAAPVAAEIVGVRGSAGALEIYGAETGTIYANGVPAPCCFIATGATARDAGAIAAVLHAMCGGQQPARTDHACSAGGPSGSETKVECCEPRRSGL